MRNWKIIKTKAGKLTYCACIGDRLQREFDDVGYALKHEENNEFSNTLNDFLRESKLSFEAKQRGERFEMKTEIIDSTAFRSLQRKLEKEEAKK